MDGANHQLDLFSPWGAPGSYRNMIDAMAYPLVSISKDRDVRKPIHYEGSKGVSVTVSANALHGMATIWDWDLVIGFVSMLNDAQKKGRKVSPRIRFRPFDLLECIYRSKGGKNYHELAAAIRRLRHTAIDTNIRLDDQCGVEQGFTILNDSQIPTLYATRSRPGKRAHEDKPDPNREWVVELSPWVFHAVVSDQPKIKLIPPTYFSLKGAIERFIYSLAHKGISKKRVSFSLYMDTLYRLSGSCGRPYDFQKKVGEIARTDSLPDYRVVIDGGGASAKVHLYRKAPPKRQRAEAIQEPPKSAQELLEDELPY